MKREERRKNSFDEKLSHNLDENFQNFYKDG